ncbi:MAG TPA: hypothetical protein PKV80_29235 [Leptospiraceae bacterium]|nr:hypothetical protein [Leptospiraceae bacterium]
MKKKKGSITDLNPISEKTPKPEKEKMKITSELEKMQALSRVKELSLAANNPEKAVLEEEIKELEHRIDSLRGQLNDKRASVKTISENERKAKAASQSEINTIKAALADYEVENALKSA